MNNKLKEKVNEIKQANNTVYESKKNLTIEIVCGVVLAVVLGIGYCFFRSWELLVCLILVPPAMIGFCINAYFKEKRHDKSSEKDKQEFLNGAKYREHEWKSAYYEYKEKHSFEEISKKGMKHDLMKRFRTSKNRGFAEAGLLMVSISIAAIFYPIEGFYFGYSVLGVLFGSFIMVWGIYSYVGGPVKKFCKNRTDLAEIEKSYNKGKMLSYKVNGINTNGINFGSRYTVIYNNDKVIAIENNTIENMVRKMVRVKKYQNDVYTGQEYNYYVSIIYREQDGRRTHIDVQLNEFQCEMMITEFHKMFYDYNKHDNIVSETIDNEIVTP